MQEDLRVLNDVVPYRIFGVPMTYPVYHSLAGVIASSTYIMIAAYSSRAAYGNI